MSLTLQLTLWLSNPLRLLKTFRLVSRLVWSGGRGLCWCGGWRDSVLTVAGLMLGPVSHVGEVASPAELRVLSASY